MSAALQRGWRKAARTVLQMAAAGSLTAVVAAVADGLNPTVAGFVLAGWGVLVTFLQNYLETAGTIPTLLPTPGTVPSRGVAPVSVGTVATTVEDVGGDTSVVVGTVEGLEGEVLGEVSGVFDDDQAG
jgi:hypothetical protein